MNTETIKVLSHLKNNSLANKKSATINTNKLTNQIISLLYKEGYILSFKRVNSNKISIILKKWTRLPILKNLKICSSPSKTIFVSFKQISHLNTNKNLYLFSTSKGIMTGNECKASKVGGILLFYC